MPRVLPVVVIALAILLLAIPAGGRVAADAGLTATVASTYFLRYDDAGLHAIAHERVAELAACDCLDHDRMRPNTAEVIGFNAGYTDPVGQVVRRWRASPEHNAILGNRSYGRIGCAELVADGTHWFACVLGFGALPPQPPPPPVLLPNTALPADA